ncbi:hypothetical protein CTI12_AA038640 [Artemisia annua]|uniref:Nucleolar pre-ribosomal-associated protein 1 n=1 Tax=Artemisia annua TaxID=35608 RepID=A0A2U1QEN9_ARTAN|nr:hypothetical protein CTI12_AA038640 [Artemisia annua]
METNEPTNPNIQTPPNFSLTPSHEAKLTQLLRNITSVDIQLCSESSKEFITLLKSDTGGALLKQYIQTSPQCSELLNAWNLRCSKGGLSYIMSLLNVILSHRDGLYNASDIDRISLSRALDKLARVVLEEKMEDVYKEMNGKESRAKNAALLLLGSVVRRGSGLAADVAKSFNFKMPGFLKLAEYDKRRRKDVVVKRKGVSTRRAFIRFAMSFLEVGDTRLLRWVLQQKEMFSGVLRGLGSDEDETVGYVLGTLRDKVLVKESLVGVGLRSVLFGSVTLEQLVEVSGRGDGGDGVEVAKKVLFMVCTDSANGLMPDTKASLKGNVTRLLGVMKKLKATEIEFHRDLLLGIVYGRPTFGSAYLDDFPYNLDDPATWFAAVSLAANLISSVNAGLSYEFLDSQAHEPTSLNSPEVQSIIKCIGPRTFNRIVINKGLLHSDSHIQHGTLRLVLDSLKLLDSLFSAMRLRSKSNKKNELKWMSLKQDIQNEVQLLLPDHQVLLSLISSLNNRFKSEERTLKRGADKTVLHENKRSKKKLKTLSSNEETDILVGGISSSLDDIMTTVDNGKMEEDDNVNEVDNLKEESRLIVDLWESHDSNNLNVAAEDEELYFYSKLLDALKVYHRTMPLILEGSFDFFKVLPSNALSLPTILQQSLLSLLVEHIGWSSKHDTPVRFPPLMYKHLTHFINLVVNSPIKDIKDQAYVLAQAAMLSSGAFDNATSEINAWLLFLPGFGTKSTEEKGIEMTHNLSSVVVSFFCDVVSTVGNNLFKYWDLLRFAAVSLAANLISSVNAGLSYEFLDSQPHEPPSLNSPEVQSVIKCIGPRTFNRIVINKGLLHSDSHIQHGTLRLVLELLKLLDSLFSAIRLRSKSNKKNELKWMSLKQDVQNEVQLLLPDHQVLLSLISSLNNRYKSEERTLKRGADKTVLLENKRSKKKLKTRSSNEETDILVGGISSSLDDIMTTVDNGKMEEDDNVNEVDNLKEESRLIVDLWESHDSNNLNVVAEDEELYFYSKLLDALKIYHRTMPSILEGSFDFFKVLPSNALSLPTILQQSLLSLLVEHIGWSSKQDTPVRFPPLMYKHLTHFINLVVNSPVKDIKDQAYVLAQAAMLSSGAFDNATSEINVWLWFLPGFSTKSTEEKGIETTHNLSSVVVSFFCDVVSTVGNNLFKYWGLLRSQIHRLENVKDVKFQFGPLFVCVLEKCVRLLGSESGTFTLPEKSMISMYVSNTLRYLLQTQVEAGLLSSLIHLTLSDRLENIEGDSREWRALKSLLHFSRSVTDTESCMLSPIDRKRALNDDDSFVNRLGEFTSLAESERNPGIITAFSSSMLSASPDRILQHFPAVISISKNLGGVPFSIILSICFLERGFLNDVCKSWPELSFLGLERVVAAVDDQSNGDYSSLDSTKFEALYYFLNKVPFSVLFPAIVSTVCLYLSESAKLQDLLLAKLSKEISDNFVCSFRLVFFWLHHIRSSYRDEQAEELVKISEICFVLIKSMLASAGQYVQEIAETIFCHPAVIGVVESPLSVNSELKDNIFEHPVDDFLCSAKEGVHRMDYHLLQVLEIYCNQFSLNEQVTRAFKCVIQKLVLMLKDRFDQLIESKDPLSLIPTLFAIYTLVRFISPQELLELACWMFSRIVLSSVHKSSKFSALSVALNIAGCAFDSVQETDVTLFEKVYFHVVEIASCSELLAADLCLLKAVKIVNTRSGRTSQSLPQSMVMSRVVASTPMNLLSKCLKKPSTVKSQLLFHLTELSLIHLSFFGLPFMEMVNKSSAGKKRKAGARDDDLVMLLPTALSFLSFISIRYGDKCYKHVGNIHSLYWDILSDGFSNWKNFVSRDLFHVTLDKSVPSTVEELCICFDTSLLGRSVAVMQQHIVSSGATVKRSKRLKLFDSLIPSGTDNLLDCNALEIDHYSIDQSLNLVMKVVTKVRLCKMLLFAKGESELSSLEVMSNKEQLRSVLLINTLISTWRLIVKKFSLRSTSQSEVEGTKFSLFRLLEIFLSKIFVEVITEMHKNSDTESNSAVKLEQLAKSCLLHRFEDSATLSMLQNVLTFEAEDKSLHIQILQLLLAHSQFAPTIQSASKSSSSVQFGIIFRPMSSILRSLTFASTDYKSPSSELYMKQLKLVKLLGVLCHFRAGFEQDIGINTKELMFLLLSSYGATVSEKDMEIYKIMQELERVEESSKNYIGDMDYLWGLLLQEENLPIDPRMCAATVLHFPYDRSLSSGALSCNKLTDDISGHVREVYDPVFILRMSLHGLSMDYIEPIEYANLGLLAVAFVSLSSPDEEIRKLGYKVLAVFRDALEVSLKRKEVNRLRPLLNYVQNGISEAWQRIPSVHAIFAAEASVLLLDPSNNHYKTITKLLLHSPMNTKMVSFFDEFFWSNSVDFKSDRIWILRLLYSGLNLEDDAQIYARSSTLEKLLSFYSSPFSDNESRELILQVVKESLRFDKTSRYLIEHCGVISWLSSLISSFCGSTYQEQKGVLQSQLAVILEVANIVVASRNTVQWLETRSVEQLTQLSCHLYALFVDNFELVKEIHSVDSILEVISSTLMLSQNRDAFQPHFTFSVEGLYQLSEAIDVNCNAELGLKVVLMSTPQAAILNMDQERLQKFVLWAASVALQSDKPCEQTNDSLLSKLLRWLTASVILARPTRQLGVEESKHNLENTLPGTLQSFLETEWSASRMASGSEEVLAATIYYLQQIIGRKCEVITSVVTSLCLLLFPDSSHTSALLSRIHCPIEVNPLWRWSFEQPWKDVSTVSESVDDFQACQSLLLAVSNILGKKSSLSHFLSDLDLEILGVEWERSLLAETL